MLKVIEKQRQNLVLKIVENQIKTKSKITAKINLKPVNQFKNSKNISSKKNSKLDRVDPVLEKQINGSKIVKTRLQFAFPLFNLSLFNY